MFKQMLINNNFQAINHNSQLDLFFETDLNNYNNKPYKFSNNIRFADLFCGIGGFRIALNSLNAECVFSSDWDKNANLTYKANFNEQPNGDITKINPKDIPNFDILTAGFPCQPFSKIGLREGFKHKTQGNLFFNIEEILKIKKPISFILENVSGLLTHKSNNIKTIDVIFNKLHNLGYEIHYKVLDAVDFGLPQIRKRIFIVGFLKKHFKKFTNFTFPKVNFKKHFINEFLENNHNDYCISDHLQKSYIFKNNDKHPQIIDKNSNIAVKTLVSSYHKIQRITGTFVKDGKTKLRLLTENECKAIMGFPKNFKFPVSRTQMYRQLGNSVAVPVVKYVAKSVFKVLNDHFTNATAKKK